MPKLVFTDAYAVFLDVLTATRKRVGMSQAELARRIGREQPFVSLIERGVRRVDVIEFCALMRAMGEDPASVLRDIDARLPGDLKV